MSKNVGVSASQIDKLGSIIFLFPIQFGLLTLEPKTANEEYYALEKGFMDFSLRSIQDN